MRIAVSNIAWPAEADEQVAADLKSLCVDAIEIAPTKLWPKPLYASDGDIDACREWWESRGIAIVAAQALLFGQPNLTLFDTEATRERTLDYLGGIARLCGRLGAKPLVFGSLKNRLRGSRTRAEVRLEALSFFTQLGKLAVAACTVIGIEANPTDYGADFLTTAAEALELVRAVNHPGVRLNLDTACMTLAGDDPNVILPEAADVLAHFHASEPHLGPVGRGGVDHARYARLLKSIGYRGFVSLEMRQSEPFDRDAFRACVSAIVSAYG